MEESSTIFVFLVWLAQIPGTLANILTIMLVDQFYANGVANWHSQSVFMNGPGNWGSIPVWVIPKVQKIVVDSSFLYNEHYKAWINGKCSNPEKEVSPSSTLRSSSY